MGSTRLPRLVVMDAVIEMRPRPLPPASLPALAPRRPGIEAGDGGDVGQDCVSLRCQANAVRRCEIPISSAGSVMCLVKKILTIEPVRGRTDHCPADQTGRRSLPQRGR
jgi:hypothetical protein